MTTYKEIFGKPIKVLSGDPAPTPITYTVTVANPGSGNVYYIDGVQTPTLELYEGNTYNFDYSAATGHPFRFATAADAAGSTEYTTGVSVDSNITTIVVASGAPNLFYYCTNHSGMGGRALTPAGPDEYTGQIWYNETTGKFRSVVATSAWSSGSPLSTARATIGGAGIQTSAVVFGGVPALNTTEEYNGSGFSAGGNMNTGRSYLAGCGTQTAGLGFGGYTTAPNTQGQALTEEYDGSSWTVGGTLNTSRYGAAGAGTQTAGLAFGGYNNGLPPGNVTNATEEYNGSSWTTSPGTMGTARYEMAGAGLQTAALAALGYKYGSPLRTTATEEYDGSSWTAGGNATTERSSLKGGGIQTSMLVFGGTSPPGGQLHAQTEAYNGTSWSNQPSLATARRRVGAASNTPGSSTGLCVGGQTPPNTGATEEFTTSANVITAAAFASGGNLPASWYGVGASQFGTQNSGLSFAGNNPGAYTGNTASFLYNGSSWTATPSMSTARAYLSGFGTSTSAVGAGGATGPGAKVTSTEEYDGSSWTNGGALGTARSTLASAGASITSGVVFGGAEPAASNKTEEYNGSSWTAVTAMPTSTADPGGNGIQTSALMVGGNTGPATVALEYDGTNWTAGGSTSVDHKKGGVLGSSSDSAIVCGGHTAPQTAVEGYDGTAWSTRPSMATARGRMANVGTASSGFVAGGNPSATNATEEWTGETTALNYKNISSS